jgi:hypothetical protein
MPYRDYNNIFKELNYGVFMGLVWLEDKIANIMEKYRKSKEIKPYVPRPNCFLYGFTTILRFMRDSGDNQCALKIRFYDPCEMEMMGDKPRWSECPLNTEENRKNIEGNLEKIRVFPKEFRPAKGKWDGILLKVWKRHIDDTAIEE